MKRIYAIIGKKGGDRMTGYIEPIRFAFLFFPIIALIFTLPYIFHQYHKYGSILFLRVSIVYSFILYLTCIYFLVILPLPSIESVKNMTTDWIQLTPFLFIKEFFLYSSFIWNDPNTYLEVLKEPYFYQVFYNILLTIPFGIYLRYYFKYNFKKTLFLTILLTLFFEGTQLSGLYGIYPRPYRLFDIDDLFLNTLGGIIGYGITPLFSHFLPDRKTLDQKSYQKGKRVSILRRTIATWIDLVFIFLMTMIMNLIGMQDSFLQYLLSILILFMIIPMITKGLTLGKKCMNIKIVTENEETPKWYQYWIRYGILYLFFLPAPFYLYLLLSIGNVIFFIGFSILFFICFIHGFISMIRRKPFWYERMSQTKNKSTIVVEEEA